jgi:phospholipid/cholesterol/gamma-HCH transport system substrate-binding protein
MKSNKVNYIIVGSFVIAIMIGIVVSASLLAGRTGATDDYFVEYGSVGGIEFGTQVLYEGFPIGQVEQVTPVRKDGTLKFRVDVSVKEDWLIPTDSVAEVASSGLLSAVTINIRAGESKTALKSGSQIEGRGASNMMAAVGDLANDVRRLTETDVKPLLANLTKVAGSVGKILDAEGTALIKEVRETMGAMSEQTPEIIENVTRFTEKLNTSADQLEKVLSSENVETINSILSEMNDTAGNLTKLTEEFVTTRETLDGLLTKLDGITGRVGTLITDNQLDVDQSIIEMRHTVETVARHINAINQNLEGASRNMFEFSRQIRQNPGLLLGGTPPEDKAPVK